MKRIIKFRAWDSSDESMWSFDLLESRNFGKDWLRGMEIMEFTGLKDKNGNEIYEGDIISIRHPYNERGYIGEIFYDEDAGAFRAKGFHFPHHDNPSDFVESLKYSEVIGNIYENKDLR